MIRWTEEQRPDPETDEGRRYEAGRECAKYGFLSLENLAELWPDAPDEVRGFYQLEEPALDHCLCLGLGDALAEKYLEHTGISVDVALDTALLAQMGNDVKHALERMPEEERNQALAIEARLEILMAAAACFRTGEQLDPDPELTDQKQAHPEVLTSDVLASIAAQAQAAGSGRAAALWAVAGPREAQKERQRYRDLLAPYRLTPDERAAKVEELLEGRPTIQEYLRQAGWPVDIAENFVLKGLFYLYDNKSGGVAADEALLQLLHPDDLGDRFLLPQAFQSAHDARRLARQAERVQQGALELGPEEPAHVLEADVPLNQLAAVSSAELRVMAGALRCFSSQSDDGVRFRHGSVSVAWRTFCVACGTNTRQTKSTRDLFTAAHTFGRRIFRGSVEYQRRKGLPKALVLYEGPLLSFLPVWHEEDSDVRKALEVWKRGGPWKGRLPDSVVLTLSEIARTTLGAIRIDGSFLERLDAGAKAVRGTQGGIQSLDALLYFELQRQGVRQGKHKGPNGNPLSFLDRDAFLLDFYGAEKVEQYRKAGLYGRRIEKNYLNAVEVLVSGGLVYVGVELGRQSRNGRRDVFELVSADTLREEENRKALGPDPAQGRLL